jgi:hypothetical protein
MSFEARNFFALLSNFCSKNLQVSRLVIEESPMICFSSSYFFLFVSHVRRFDGSTFQINSYIYAPKRAVEARNQGLFASLAIIAVNRPSHQLFPDSVFRSF